MALGLGASLSYHNINILFHARSMCRQRMNRKVLDLFIYTRYMVLEIAQRGTESLVQVSHSHLMCM